MIYVSFFPLQTPIYLEFLTLTRYEFKYFVLMLLGLEELENFQSCKICVRLFSRSQWP